MSTLYLLSGIPGSGKTTWGKAQSKRCNGIHVSLDECRYSLLEEGEGYFSKDTEAFNLFISKIQDGLKTNENVFADATHNREQSRNKTLDKLNLSGAKLVGVDFNVPLDVCLSQNDLRTGRARIPHDVITRMWYQREPFQLKEKYSFNKIIKVWKEEI